MPVTRHKYTSGLMQDNLAQARKRPMLIDQAFLSITPCLYLF